MTDEQINIAIAESLGWTKGVFRTFDFGCDGREMGDVHGWWKVAGSKSWGDFATKIPDYANDLNAMHEAEKFLQDVDGTWGIYVFQLGEACKQTPDHLPNARIHATARQRAEAYLRTIGKWITN